MLSRLVIYCCAGSFLAIRFKVTLQIRQVLLVALIPLYLEVVCLFRCHKLAFGFFALLSLNVINVKLARLLHPRIALHFALPQLRSTQV